MMNDTTLISLIATLVGIVGGLFALFRGVDEVRQSREIRQQEFRWKQADAAKELIEKMSADKNARCAMKMLDWENRQFDDNGRQTAPISAALMMSSLRVSNMPQPDPLVFTPDEVFVRDCFEALFDEYERFENYVRINLINFEDVKFPIGYYVRLMAHNKRVFHAFLQTYGYELALGLLDRFPEWRAANR
jgi:hypothetical protein